MPPDLDFTQFSSTIGFSMVRSSGEACHSPPGFFLVSFGVEGGDLDPDGALQLNI